MPRGRRLRGGSRFKRRLPRSSRVCPVLSRPRFKPLDRECEHRAGIDQQRRHSADQPLIAATTLDRAIRLIERGIVGLSARSGGYLFRSQTRASDHHSTRQYARFVRNWVGSICLNPAKYGTHSLRRTKVAALYRKTGNLRVVQLPLGHTKLESTVRYLGVEVDDALTISEQVDL